MEDLADAIADSVALVRDLFASVGNAEGNIAGLDASAMWETVSSIAGNITGFLTQLVGELAMKL